MSYRERSALFMTILLALAGALYVKWTAFDALGITEATLWLVGLVVLGSIIVQAVVAGRRPDEANAPEDEREALISGRAARHSGQTLALGAALGLFQYLRSEDPALMYHTVAISLIAAQIVDYGIQYVLLRRG